MADIPLSNALSSGQRRAVYVLTSSNATLPIPSWAQGGKGIVRITGCGAGASGSVRATPSERGGGGGAGAFAIDHPMPIPAGVTTLNCQVGVGGAAVSSNTFTDGNSGGSTSVTAGSTSLVLEGGLGGQFTGAGPLRPAYPLPNGMSMTGITGSVALGPLGASLAAGVFSGASSLGAGALGGNGQQSAQGFGAGAWSPFGAGGAGVTAVLSNQAGGNATGYGAGGAGANWASGGNVSSGAGAPGLLILEFVEGL